jgi:hypothetical protein
MKHNPEPPPDPHGLPWNMSKPSPSPANYDAALGLPAAARNTDPVTSHLSESELTDSGDRGRMVEAAVAAVYANRGLTARELEVAGGYENGQLRKRLNDEWRKPDSRICKGAVKRCPHSGRLAETWWPVGVAQVPAVALPVVPALSGEAKPC